MALVLIFGLFRGAITVAVQPEVILCNLRASGAIVARVTISSIDHHHIEFRYESPVGAEDHLIWLVTLHRIDFPRAFFRVG